jgi:uncharacterized protein
MLLCSCQRAENGPGRQGIPGLFVSEGPFHNLLEPPALIRHFLNHPPDGFSAFATEGGAPSFSTTFDLLTTMEPAVRRRLEALPLSRWWRRLLRKETCFIGTTVSEYALFPRHVEPDDFVRGLAPSMEHHPLVIIKDMPTEATLVGEAAFDYSSRVADGCRRAGFVLVEGQALAYVPIDFSSIDEFLARSSKRRRRNLRRKLRSLESLQIEAVPTGDACFADDAFTSSLYVLYDNVYAQSEIHFDRLTPAFFRAVLQDPALNGIVFLYRAKESLIGWNLCLVQDGMLIDKYVGFAYPEAREHDLYAVSWFHNLEYAMERGMRHYVAGWTDPEVKRQLGARFTFTRHAVHVRNPVVRMLLTPFRRWFESDRNWQAADVARSDS